MPNYATAKSAVKDMLDAGASDDDIKMYLKSLGVSPEDAKKNFAMLPPAPQREPVPASDTQLPPEMVGKQTTLGNTPDMSGKQTLAAPDIADTSMRPKTNMAGNGLPVPKLTAGQALQLRAAQPGANLTNPRNIDNVVLSQQAQDESNRYKQRTAPENFADAGVRSLGEQFWQGPKQLLTKAANKLGWASDADVANQAQDVASRRQDQALLQQAPGGTAGNAAGLIAGAVLPTKVLKAPALLENAPGIAKAAQTVLAPRTLTQAPISGGVLGGVQPTAPGESNLTNATEGALFQTMGVGGGNLLARGALPLPNTTPEAKFLLNQGIVPTPGQAAQRNLVGRLVSGAEEKAQSIPIIGDIITSARNRALDETRAAAMKTAGYRGGVGTPTDFINAGKNLSQSFEKIAPGTNIPLGRDWTIKTFIDAVKAPGISLNPDGNRTVLEQLDNIYNRTKNGKLSGAEYAKTREDLGKQGRSFLSSPMPYDRATGKALLSVQNTLDDAFEKARPDLADEIQLTRQRYGNLKILEDAAQNATKEGSVKFTPGQLQAAVNRAALNNHALATGTAKLKDLSNAMVSLDTKLPNSGSVDRFLGAGALAGLAGANYTGMVDPVGSSLGLGGVAAAYGIKPVTKYLVGGYPGQTDIAALLQDYASPALGALKRDELRRRKVVGQ